MTVLDPAGFGDWLRTQRQLRLLTQEQLAERAGVSVRTIRNAETGSGRRMRADTQRVLVETLGSLDPVEVVEPRPAQLPASAQPFTGRTVDLGWLDEQLGSPAPDGAATAVVVSGAPGIGKSALVLHWAASRRDQFPDGQLFADLHGHDQRLPVDPSETLAEFLRALGVAADQVPEAGSERQAAYRTLLAARRMLVVLDDAGSAEQIRPLLPGTGPSLVLVTSREDLPGLTALDGARRRALDLLPLPDGIDLLRGLVDPARAAEPDAIERIARECGGLPLALRVAAELAGARSGTLTTMADDLADAPDRLDSLALLDDPRSTVAAAFAVSYDRLPAHAARCFRRLGVLGLPQTDVAEVAVLMGGTRAEAGSALDRLVHAHLVDRAGDGRLTLHDLLHAYAGRLAETDAETPVATRRLTDYHAGLAVAAMRLLVPSHVVAVPEVVRAHAARAQFPGGVAAGRWLDRHRARMVATALVAHRRSDGDPAALLSAVLAPYLDGGAHHTDAARLHQAALVWSEHTGDEPGTAGSRKRLGLAAWRRGDHAVAAAYMAESMAAFAALGSVVEQANAMNNLGGIEGEAGNWAAAAQRCETALGLLRTTDARVDESRVLGNLGLIYLRLGDLDRAVERNREAIGLAARLGDRYAQANALASLGEIESRSGRHPSALDCLTSAVELYTTLGHRAGQATALFARAEAHQRAGDDTAARRDARSAHRMADRLADPGLRTRTNALLRELTPAR